MAHNRSLALGIMLASIAAGPVFLSANALASLYLQLPRPIQIDLSQLGGYLLFGAAYIIGGFVVSLIPNIIGAVTLHRIGKWFAPFRAAPVWILVGGLLGVLIAWLIDPKGEPESWFALIFTSAICAAICRREAAWC